MQLVLDLFRKILTMTLFSHNFLSCGFWKEYKILLSLQKFLGHHS